jgi:hypothetical protein
MQQQIIHGHFCWLLSAVCYATAAVINQQQLILLVMIDCFAGHSEFQSKLISHLTKLPVKIVESANVIPCNPHIPASPITHHVAAIAEAPSLPLS